jgi:hypothetical protein
MGIKSLMKHKYTIGAVGVVGLFVLYLLVKARGAGGASSGDGGLAALAAQQQQLSTAANIQESQIGQQSEAAQLAAAVANNQTLAQANQANHAVDASLIASLASDKYGSSVINNQTAAQLEVARLQAGLTSQGLTESSALYGETLDHQYNLNKEIVGEVGKAGLNHGTSSLENSLTAILSEVENQPSVGVAAENTNAVGAAAGASEFGSLVTAIGNLGSSALKALAL